MPNKRYVHVYTHALYIAICTVYVHVHVRVHVHVSVYELMSLPLQEYAANSGTTIMELEQQLASLTEVCVSIHI